MQSNKANVILRQDLPRELNFDEADGNFQELRNVIDDAHNQERKIFVSSLGYLGIDSFQLGAILSNHHEVLYDEVLQSYYRWQGTYPKTVPPGSSLASEGGLAQWELIDQADNEISFLHDELIALEETVDNLPAVPLWDELKPYTEGFWVEGLNRKIYRAIVANTGFNPELLANSDKWEEIQFTRVYNQNVEYVTGATVLSDGNLWKSLQNANEGNLPAVGSVFWAPAVDLSGVQSQINNIEISDIDGLVERLDEIETYALAGL